ncbi:methyltransferase domain-containing protein [Neisseriaceae bacterium TC5R-5]|nr:methyltransferase domain-containing protein [Neisseriaceae bacterium TC5R-5]
MGDAMAPLFNVPELSDADFLRFSRFIYEAAGIDLPPGKRSLVQARLGKRLRYLQLGSYGAYWRLLNEPGQEPERQRAINLLSTNETYFFREAQHFDWLRQQALRLEGHGTLRVWSAACSTGEEPYTIAMMLADTLGLSGNWLLFASDINTKVVAQAQRAIYSKERARKTPPELWKKYFLRGQDEYQDMVRVVPQLIKRVNFSNVNLLFADAFNQSRFDIIFLRNVLIYFNEETKAKVINQLCHKLRPGGHLIIGHSETIRHLPSPLVQEEPSRYRLDPAKLSRVEEGL